MRLRWLIVSVVSTVLWLAPLAAPVARAAEAEAEVSEAERASAELAKAFERLARTRFYRHGSVVFENVARLSQLDEDRITPPDQFLKDFYEGRWEGVRATLAQLPPVAGDALYDRILADLTDRYVPLLTLDDFVGLADASPSELTAQRIRSLGLILAAVVPKEQEVWLRNALEKGTRRLGGSAANRLNTGRILMHANFDDLARQYLPASAEAAAIEDDQLRDEILKFLASQEELAAFQQTRIASVWRQQASVLKEAMTDATRAQQAAERLAELLGRAEPGALEPWLEALVREQPDGALRVASALGRRAAGKTGDKDVLLRTNHLKAQKTLLRSAAALQDIGQPPWQPLAAAMADWWVQEAENTFNVAPSYRSSGAPKPFVAVGDLLDAAPDGPWLAALAPTLRERIDLSLSRAVLVSDRYEDAVEQIIQIAGRNPQAGLSLAEEYLKSWAYRHDPQVPEAVRKKYQLKSDARIVVTPLMMERNIDSLARMMAIFRENKIHPRNAALLVDAFNVCYSQAEVYRRSHLESVFGSVETMDEEIFLHMIRTMTGGLASRWRTIELQETSGTRRTPEETLQMVRDGYQAALDMIDQRFAKHPGAWRVLMLGGCLTGDWAQFEYSQQLAAESNVDRLEAYQQKTNRAEDYFTRAAQAYAGHVKDLRPSGYSIDLYVAWFDSLLGLDTSGQLRLARPLDRRALNVMRDSMRGLPGDAATAHVDRFARYVSQRMEDTVNPLHENLRYKYLAGSLVITQESPFSFQARDKVNYYDELLDEIRLETRVDGPSTIGRDQQFGIVLSVHHTEAMGRMADFGKYLVNETPAPNAPSVRQVAALYRAGELSGRRDELEQNIREVLSLFFDIRSITFSPRDVQPRATDRPGWEETVLAYVHAAALDASVDKIPRIQMSLEFLDVTGPISISAESAETMIRVTGDRVPPRPFRRLDVTQVLDARNLEADEELVLEVTATANGLVPDLEDLIDLQQLEQQLPVVRIDPHEGTLVRELNSWGDAVHVVSARRWTIALDASSLVDPPRRIEFRMPMGAAEDAVVAYRTYQDMDLVDLSEPAVVVGLGERKVETPAQAAIEPWMLAAAIGGALAVVLVIGWLIVRLTRHRGPRPLRARDVFRMPAEIDGFVAVQWLRSLAASHLVRLNEKQLDEIQQEIQRIQQACFANAANGLDEKELRTVVNKWLRTAC